jgi:purine nucleosidase
VQLEGLTVVAGNVELEHGLRAAQTILEIAQATDRVPVCAGADRPLIRNHDRLYAGRLERLQHPLIQRLWQSIPVPTPTHRVDARRAVDFIVDTVMAAPGEITLVSIGPLTNVALAIKVEPRLKDNLHRIVAMAGAVRVPGNLNPVLEFNAMYDPEATFIVLHSDIPITLVPLDATMQTCLTLEDVTRLGKASHPLARYLAQVTEPWIRWNTERNHLAGCRLHDPLAVAAAIDPTLLETQPMHVTVELEGRLTAGQTIGYEHSGYGLAPKSGPNTQVALHLDNQRFMNILFETLEQSR